MLPSTRRLLVLSVASCLLLMPGAGPLNPPAGSVAPTMKTLQDAEPRTPLSATNTPGDVASVFVITQPGSYYLTGDVRPTGGRNAIMVNADNVTIDLRGYALDGSADTTGFRAGITNSGNRRNLRVFNGTIKSFRGYGMIGRFDTSSFEDMCLLDSQGGQLEILQSSGCTVRNVRTRAVSGETGIQLGGNSTVEFCTVEGGGIGITIQSGVVRGCTVMNPGSVGIYSANGLVVDCAVEGANSTSSVTNGGITLGTGAKAERCVLRNCQSAGVNLAGRAEVIDCQFTSCARGVTANLSGRGRIEGNHFSFCTTAAVNLVGTNSIVVGNRFSGNGANIVAPAGNTLGELVDFSAAGGTVTAANCHPLANVVY
ncbi:MAG TPA: right-handed parallel beta-helix repeat-containing protein [Phycisphaerales bacterium]|nr:right-handed parallel beta-helix repeat-containing protein [Phycisphaerales bacterium]